MSLYDWDMRTYEAKCETCGWTTDTDGGIRHAQYLGHKVTSRLVVVTVHDHTGNSRIEALSAALDDAGVPPTAGAVKLRAILRGRGYSVRNELVAELAKARKASI